MDEYDVHFKYNHFERLWYATVTTPRTTYEAREKCPVTAMSRLMSLMAFILMGADTGIKLGKDNHA
jgi:hypothetical protein